MQSATCIHIRIRSPADARVIFHAVKLGVLPMVSRRLDTEERGLITPGSVYVWEERGPQAELTGVGIERWTDGIRWGPSRVREGFLFYHEKQSASQGFSDVKSDYDDSSPSPSRDPSRSVLIKQTYTAFVDTPTGQRKWHLIAYFTEESIMRLRSIDDIPQLAYLHVPPGKYRSARSAKGRPDHVFSQEGMIQETAGQLYLPVYVPYVPTGSSSPPTPSPSSDQPRLNRVTAQQQQRSELSHEGRPVERRGTHPRSVVSSEGNLEYLAPLAYLQNIAPPRRHPVDEKTLMLFSASKFI